MSGPNAPRVGVFGGTFDPPHWGHLLLAEQAREQLRLDTVLFVPAGAPPHKEASALSATADRIALVEAAIGGVPGFELSRLDADSDGPSYTYALLERVAERYPTAQLYFLMGEDSLRDLVQWLRPERIIELATLAVAGRPTGSPGSADMPAVPGIEHRVAWIASPSIAISSSDIRRRVSQRLSIRFMVPDAVRDVIERLELYRAGAAATASSQRHR